MFSVSNRFAPNTKGLMEHVEMAAKRFVSIKPILEKCIHHYPGSFMRPVLEEYDALGKELNGLFADIKDFSIKQPWWNAKDRINSLDDRLSSFIDREGPFIDKVTALGQQIPPTLPMHQQEDILQNLSTLNQFMETNASILPDWLKDQWGPLKQEYQNFRIYPNTMERIHRIWNEVNALPNYADVVVSS